jgi:hypothetical protein
LTLAVEAGEASEDVKLSSASGTMPGGVGVDAMRAAVEEVDAAMQER